MAVMVPRDQDAAFFAALLAADGEALDRILTDDFLIVDVMHGSVTDRQTFVAAVESGDIVFTAIEVAEPVVRSYGATAVLVGRTTMQGRTGTRDWQVASRYTHVYVENGGTWRLASAQGTPIV